MKPKPSVEQALQSWLVDQEPGGWQISCRVLRGYGKWVVDETNKKIPTDKKTEIGFRTAVTAVLKSVMVLTAGKFMDRPEVQT